MTPSRVAVSARRLALLLAAMTVLGSLLVATQPASAFPPTLSVTPGQFGRPGLPRYPYIYVPTETVTFTVSSNTAGEAYDVFVYVGPADPTAANPGLAQFNNLTIPTGLAETRTYPIPALLGDGQNYAVAVFDQNYIENGFIGPRYARQFFAVQAYEFRVEVDRNAYIGGDWVTATWSANNLRDGALATSGYGQLWAYNTNGVFFAWPAGGNVYVFPNGTASGTVKFKLPDPGTPQFNGIIFSWFNDTASGPTRFQQAGDTYGIDSLSAIVTVAAPKVFAPGGIVTTTITTVASPNPAAPSPTDPPEPAMNVQVRVYQLTPAPVEIPSYGTGVTTLVTDAHGRLTYVFQLQVAAAQSNYEVHAQATSPSGLSQWNLSYDTFTVTAAAGLVQVLQFNKNEFQAGDTATATSIVTGAGGAAITYIFEVRDTTGVACSPAFVSGSLLAKSTQASNVYNYAIDANFAGTICFRVTANAGQGTPVTSARAFTVVFGWLLVNADPQQYNPGDGVAITWNLVSNRITAPSYYYEIRDSNGNLVESGTTGQTTNKQYAIPNPSSTRYTVTVTATELGRTVSGSVVLDQVTGFFLSVTFDRDPAAYAPGDVIKVRYTITARSASSVAPATYRLTYGLANGPARIISTNAASGDLVYAVPGGFNEGPQLFTVIESSTGTQATEVVTIRQTSPLWYTTVGDVPILVIVILVWLVLMTLLMWRRGVFGRMGRPRAPPAPPEGPAKQEPVHASPTSPMMVTCRSCASPIEITTSKRPIEVMCPKCGNTEVVS